MNQVQRRTSEDLVTDKVERYKLKFGNPQDSFTGTEDQLLLLFQAEEAYGLGHPIITDSEFDELALKTGYEQSLRAPKSSSGRNWLKLSAPLVSLRKVHNREDLDTFLGSFAEGTHFYVEPKLDGMTFNAVYDLDGDEFVLKTVSSRGDGRFGLELHPDAMKGLTKVGLPDKFPADHVKLIPGLVEDNQLHIRGEVIASPEDHPGKLLRSVAAGMMNRKIPYLSYYRDAWDLAEGEKRSVELVRAIAKGEGVVTKPRATYEAELEDGEVKVYENGELHEGLTEAVNRVNRAIFVSFSVAKDGANIPCRGLFEVLDEYGFESVDKLSEKIYSKSLTNRAGVIKFIDEAEAQVNDGRAADWGFPIDGIVIKPIDTDEASQKLTPIIKAGKVVYPHHPKDQVAYKLPPVKIVVKILKIHENHTSLGNDTFSAELDKTYVMPSGTMVSRVNLHNRKWLDLNPWIYEGAELYMHLSGDIIPVFSEMES